MFIIRQQNHLILPEAQHILYKWIKCNVWKRVTCSFEPAVNDHH